MQSSISYLMTIHSLPCCLFLCDTTGVRRPPLFSPTYPLCDNTEEEFAKQSLLSFVSVWLLLFHGRMTPTPSPTQACPVSLFDYVILWSMTTHTHPLLLCLTVGEDDSHPHPPFPLPISLCDLSLHNKNLFLIKCHIDCHCAVNTKQIV